MKEQVLNAMRAAGKPVSAGEVAKSLNADRKEVDKAFADLKKKAPSCRPFVANGQLHDNQPNRYTSAKKCGLAQM